MPFFKPLLFLTCCLVILTACIQAPTPSPSPTPEPTPTLPPLARSVDVVDNAIVVLIAIDPPSFNAYLNDSGYEALVGELIYGALAEIGHDGNYYPELALDLPTLNNGGLSEDGRTVTWHIRREIVWSDNVPFTSDDVKYTWESLRDSGIWAPGFDLIKDIETPDPYTAIVHYSQFYPNYLIQFGGLGTGVFPRHYCGATNAMLSWDCNLNPISSGPFILGEWVKGERLTFLANPHYFVPNRPLSSQIVFEVESDPKLRQRILERGEAQLDLWPYDEQILKRMERTSPNVYVYRTDPARYVLRLLPNLTKPGNPSEPNPLLFDQRVRQAIFQSIDVERLNRRAFEGRGISVQTELSTQGCAITPYYYDPGIAQAMLDQAGWKLVDPKDEVRQCVGCKTAPEGTPFILKSYRYDEFGKPMQIAHELIAEMLGRVYIKLETEPAEGGKLWGPWNDNGIELRGNFDLNFWDDGYFGVDPTVYLADYYDPRSIPTRDNTVAGLNVGRYNNPKLLEIFDGLYTPLPNNRRRALLCELATILHQDLPQIPLLALPDLYGIHRSLNGIAPHIYDTVTWNVADWQVIPLPSP